MRSPNSRNQSSSISNIHSQWSIATAAVVFASTWWKRRGDDVAIKKDELVKVVPQNSRREVRTTA